MSQRTITCEYKSAVCFVASGPALLCVVGVLSTAFMLDANVQAAEPEKKPVALGYYAANEEFAIENIPWDHLTHLCHAFLTTDSEGRIATNKLVPSRKLTSAGAEHDVPVILSVGGWGDADGFEKATADTTTMDQWVADVTKLVVDNGYAGLDIDWEFPKDESTRIRLTSLVRVLRAKFDAVEKEQDKNLLLSATVSARPKQGQWVDGPAIEPFLDFLNVMAYDLSGAWASVAAHHAPLNSSPNDPERAWRSTTHAMNYWSTMQGFPKHKLNVGIPLYGRSFPIRQPHEKLEGLPEKEFGSPKYQEIVELEKAGWMLNRDPDAQAPWMVSPSGEAEGLVAFDDPESARMKAKWARENGYRGIFFWAIGYDLMPDGKHHVVEAAADGWSK